MKKIIFGLSVAAFALLSACETLAPQDDAQQSGSSAGNAAEKVVLTATIGADTKTYLEWDGNVFKTRWSEEDEIHLWDLDNMEVHESVDFRLISGAGKSTAQFAMIDDETLPENYLAVYGYVGHVGNGNCMVYYPNKQRRVIRNNSGTEIQGFEDWDYPMLATSNGTELNFKNIASVLKLNVTGNGESLKSVSVKSDDEGVYLAGYALLNLSGSRPTYVLSEDNQNYLYDEYGFELYDEVTFNPVVSIFGESQNTTIEAVLSDTPIECHIVLPSQTYPSGLTITLITDEGMMEVRTEENLVLDQSELREIPVLNYQTTAEAPVAPEDAWVVEFSEDGGESWSVTEYLSKEDGMYVFQDLYCSGESTLYLRLYETNSGMYYGCSSDYVDGRCKTNARVDLVSDVSRNLSLWIPGNYDIYIDAAEDCFYIMSDGCLPGELPVDGTVICDQYEDIAAVSEGEWVKIHGVVLARTNYGFIAAIDGYYYNNAFVYDKSNLCSAQLGNWIDIYAKVAYYRYLPELVVEDGAYWYRKLNDQYSDYNAEDPVVVTTITDYDPGKYEYFRYSGTLNGSVVTGDDGGTLSIGTQSIFDLTQYDGQDVYVEGYFAGRASEASVPVMFLKRIYPSSDGSSTEDVIPGESFPVS